MATARGKCERARVTREQHLLGTRCPLGDREVTQKTSGLQRFMEYWFILVEAHLRQSGEDCKRKKHPLCILRPLPKPFIPQEQMPSSSFAFLLAEGGGREGK